MREKGKMTVHYGSEEEMLTLTAKGLKLRGSDDDFEEGIQQQQDRTEGLARYVIVPWNLTCVLRQHENFVYVDMYLGEQAWDLISLRLA